MVENRELFFNVYLKSSADVQKKKKKKELLLYTAETDSKIFHVTVNLKILIILEVFF